MCPEIQIVPDKSAGHRPRRVLVARHMLAQEPACTTECPDLWPLSISVMTPGPSEKMSQRHKLRRFCDLFVRIHRQRLIVASHIIRRLFRQQNIARFAIATMPDATQFVHVGVSTAVPRTGVRQTDGNHATRDERFQPSG